MQGSGRGRSPRDAASELSVAGVGGGSSRSGHALLGLLRRRFVGVVSWGLGLVSSLVPAEKSSAGAMAGLVPGIFISGASMHHPMR